MPEPKVFDEDTRAWTHGAAIADLSVAPTAADFNKVLAVLRSAGLIARD